MDPLTGAAAGLSIISSLGSLFGGGGGAARRARDRAISDYLGSALGVLGEKGYLGRRMVMSLAGDLGDALGTSGGALGSAMARAGVWNSTAVAGALQKEQESNAAKVAQAWSALAGELAGQRGDILGEVARMRVGAANSDASRADADKAGALAGLGQLFGALGQIGGAKAPATVKSTPTTKSVGVVQTPMLGQQPELTLGGSPTAAMQSWIQQRTPSVSNAWGNGIGMLMRDRTKARGSLLSGLYG